MNFEEFKILVKGMKAVYTSEKFLPDADSIKIWFQMLQDLEYKVASAAIQKYMLTNKFPPTIADIREMASSVSHGDIPEWGAGWQLVQEAIRKYGTYNEGKAMRMIQEQNEIAYLCTQRLGFKNLCMSERIETDRANFRMMYESLAERKKQDQQLSLPLSQTIQQIQQRNVLQLDNAGTSSVAQELEDFYAMAVDWAKS